MKHTMVRYTVRKERLEQVRKALGEFVDSVRMQEPYTFYDAFQDGERSFVHLMAFRDEKSETLHNSADYTNRFLDLLYSSCEAEPESSGLSLVRSSRQERKW